jgi:hypothetical protein
MLNIGISSSKKMFIIKMWGRRYDSSMKFEGWNLEAIEPNLISQATLSKDEHRT